VPQLVRGDVPDPGGLGAAGQFLADGGLGHAATVVGEQELGGATGAGVWQRSAGRAGGGDAVDEFDGLVVEGDHPFAVELAEGDFQPSAVAGDLVPQSSSRSSSSPMRSPTARASSNASAASRYSDRWSASLRRRSASTGT
jgi:hypothetical protein